MSEHWTDDTSLPALDALVTALNEHWPDANISPPFSVSANGVTIAVEFCGLCLWSTNDDGRKWLDDERQEPIGPYVLREARAYTENLTAMLGACAAALPTEKP